VEKVFDRTDMKVKPKNLEQIANDMIIFYKNPGPFGDTQFKHLKTTALTVGGQPYKYSPLLFEGLIDTFTTRFWVGPTLTAH
jgi:hypothetical protein